MGCSPTVGTAEAALSRVFREEAGRLVGSLVRRVGDFDLAEELVQDAIVEALEHWPVTGVPANPGGWLALTARRKALDRVRRNARLAEKLHLVAISEAPREEAEAPTAPAESPAARLLLPPTGKLLRAEPVAPPGRAGMAAAVAAA